MKRFMSVILCLFCLSGCLLDGPPEKSITYRVVSQTAYSVTYRSCNNKLTTLALSGTWTHTMKINPYYFSAYMEIRQPYKEPVQLYIFDDGGSQVANIAGASYVLYLSYEFKE